ncbi:MAG: hypothetical protein R6V40_04875 [Candidatus Moraniibacteriota bacterium]
MEKFESYRPTSLLELSDTEIAEISLDGQRELVELVLLESRETVNALSAEVDEMDEEFFSLDSFYEIQAVVEEYRAIMDDLSITDEDFEKHLQFLLKKIEEKNPISEVAMKNYGNVLIHSSDLTSLKNLLGKKTEVSEVCATAGSLRKKGDIFRSKKKAIHAGLVFDPQQASAWFSKDVGSHTSGGKRVLEPRFEQFRCDSMAEALEKKTGERVEAWINTQITQPVALLLIDPDRKDEVVQLARQNNYPVLFNSHLY